MTTDAGAPGAPRFDVVLRGYDRRQVDEHVSRLQRALNRTRSDLDTARSQPFPAVASPSAGFPQPGPGGPGGPGPGGAGPGQQAPPGGRPRPTPRPRPGGPGDSPDMIGSFTDRMQSILQAAEDEAAEIRKKAHGAARAENDAVRAELGDLVRQRDLVLGELTRMRGQLEGLLSAPTARITLPPRPDNPPPSRPAPIPSSGGPASPGGALAAGERPAPVRRMGGPSNGAPSNGSFAAAAAPPASSGDDVTKHDATKAPAHRLPTGAYPAVPDKPASMRPRTEPDPEPGDLFRPVTETSARAAVAPKPEAGPRPDERTMMVPTVRPTGAASESPTQVTPKPTPPAAGVEATMQVGAVRPTPSTATVLTPAAKPAAPQPANKDEPGNVDEGAARPKAGPNGSDTANRSTSPSRSG